MDEIIVIIQNQEVTVILEDDPLIVETLYVSGISHAELASKADKVTSAIENDVVTLDPTGNIKDSGVSISSLVAGVGKTSLTVGRNSAEYTTIGTADSPQILAAIAQADTNIAVKKVSLLSGDFDVDAQINRNAFSVPIEGSGAYYFSSASGITKKPTRLVASTAIASILKLPKSSESKVSNMAFYATTASAAYQVTDGIRIRNSLQPQKNLQFSDLLFEQLNYGIQGDPTVVDDPSRSDVYDNDDSTFINLMFRNCVVGWKANTSGTNVYGGVFGGCTTAVQIMNFSAVTFFGTTFTKGNTQIDLIGDNKIIRAKFEGCWFEGAEDAIIKRSGVPASSDNIGGVTFIDCNFNNQVGYDVILSGVTGTFVVGSTITGGTSGATATITKITGSTLRVKLLTATNFSAAETVSQSSPGAASGTCTAIPILAYMMDFTSVGGTIILENCEYFTTLNTSNKILTDSNTRIVIIGIKGTTLPVIEGTGTIARVNQDVLQSTGGRTLTVADSGRTYFCRNNNQTIILPQAFIGAAYHFIVDTGVTLTIQRNGTGGNLIEGAIKLQNTSGQWSKCSVFGLTTSTWSINDIEGQWEGLTTADAHLYYRGYLNSDSTTDNIPEGSNLYFTNERVDDRVSALIQNGTGITWLYNDGSGTLTPTVTITQYTDALAQAAVGIRTLFTQTADVTVTNTTSETSILGTGVGSKTLAANYLIAGKTIRIRVGGIYSTPLLSTPSIVIKVKYGSTVIATVTTTSLLVGASGLEFDGEILFTCRSAGASGTVMTHGDIEYGTGVTGTIAVDPLNNGGATTTIDTTASSALDVTVTWDTATSTRIAKSTVCTIEALN